MKKTTLPALVATVLIAASPAVLNAQQQAQPMSFFITSIGVGDGANLGGLKGADEHCDALARTAGVTDGIWRAYLSTTAGRGQVAVNARDRIGDGPWYNASGQMVAGSVADLHGDVHRDRNQINKRYALNEKG